MPMIAAKITGTPKVVILNARPRTCSRYSRRATSQILRIDLASNCLNKDFFQRRLDHLETVDGCHGRRFAQQLLCVAVRLQLDLRMTRKVRCFRYLQALEKIGAALKFNNDV